MTTFHIKLLAIATMTIDHIGLFFFPNTLEFRLVGRLSFPLFAWLIANGAFYTKNEYKYALRLLAFALISQIPFSLALSRFNLPEITLNIFFTLFFGLASIIIYKRKTINNPLKLFLVAAICTLAAFLNTDYGAIGVLSILTFYIFFKNLEMMVVSQAIIYILISPVVEIITNLILSKPTLTLDPIIYFQPIGLSALIFISRYNFKEGPKLQYLFYAYYPLHLIAIYFILETIK